MQLWQVIFSWQGRLNRKTFTIRYIVFIAIFHYALRYLFDKLDLVGNFRLYYYYGRPLGSDGYAFWLFYLGTIALSLAFLPSIARRWRDIGWPVWQAVLFYTASAFLCDMLTYVGSPPTSNAPVKIISLARTIFFAVLIFKKGSRDPAR